MSENVRQKAQETLALVDEVNAVVLPEPTEAYAVVPLAKAAPEVGEEIRTRMAEIDMAAAFYARLTVCNLSKTSKARLRRF